MIKPAKTLLLLSIVGAAGLLLMLIFPSDGIQLSKNTKLEFPSLTEFFGRDTTLRGSGVDVQTLLQAYQFPVDSTKIRDSIQQVEIAFRKEMLKLQFPEDQGQSILDKFYESLSLARTGKKVRVLHYGDSQIEGDRITSFVREQLQSKFGGRGPGYLPLYEVIPNFSIRQAQSENWIRYTAYGKRDTTLNHTRFGMWGSFSRFSPFVVDSLLDTTATHQAWVRLNPSKLGFKHVRNYNKATLHLGRVRTPLQIRAFEGETVVDQKVVAKGTLPTAITFTFASTPQDLLFEFKAADSPDFYGMSLEGTGGIVLDNIAMRGSSGTIFSKMDGQGLGGMLRKEPISLVILQYGGNTVPYIDSPEKARKYGEWFEAQIKALQRALPNASFILIGPSDMSTKVKNNYVTFPHLMDVRDALKDAAFRCGAAYWDLFEVMGGRNSMPGWVQTDPPLAAPDYIHFTPNGARRVADLFYQALMEHYQDFVARKKREGVQSLTIEGKNQDSLKMPEA
jgi:lysophospholipase L1-like esterase